MIDIRIELLYDKGFYLILILKNNIFSYYDMHLDIFGVVCKCVVLYHVE